MEKFVLKKVKANLIHQGDMFGIVSSGPSSIAIDLTYDTKRIDEAIKKVGEEATETVMAAKDDQAEKIIYEVADLWFHTLVLLAHKGLKPADVLNELARREGLSGLEEKANRYE